MTHVVAPEAIAGVNAFLVSDAAAPVSGAIPPEYGAQAGPGVHTAPARPGPVPGWPAPARGASRWRSLVNHRDPAMAFHLAGGKPGPVAKAGTAARDLDETQTETRGISEPNRDHERATLRAPILRRRSTAGAR